MVAGILIASIAKAVMILKAEEMKEEDQIGKLFRAEGAQEVYEKAKDQKGTLTSMVFSYHL